MTRPCHKLNFFEVVAFTFCIVTIVFLDKVSHFFLVIFAYKLSDDFFSDVSANIFVIVTFASHLLFSEFFENMQSSRLLICDFFFFILMQRTMIVDDDIVGERLRWPDIPDK